MVCVGVLSSVISYLVFGKALLTLSALKHGTEFRVRHSQHIHREEIAVDPGVQNVRTRNVCRGSVISAYVFKKVRIASGEEKKWYSHPLRTDVASHFHEARVIAHAAVHGYQGIDAGVSCRREQARRSAPTP